MCYDYQATRIYTGLAVNLATGRDKERGTDEAEGVEKDEWEGPGASRIPRPRLHRQMQPGPIRANVHPYIDTYARMPAHTHGGSGGAAEGKNKVGVSRPRYVRACTRQREIRGHKPAYYAPPRATNTPNNGRGSLSLSLSGAGGGAGGMRAPRYRIKL